MDIRCVARGVVKKSTSKNNADLNENRSSEFMAELKKATSTTYFPRFLMKLRAELGGIPIDHSFMAKWSQIEAALYYAVGKEQNVNRMSSFYAKDHSNFDSKPMELIIFEVDTHVDKTLGRSEKTFTDKKGRIQSMITYRLMTKYSIIFQIAENLPTEVKLMKDYICQATSNILSDIEKLVDVSDFQDSLTEEFTKKGNLSDYKNYPIPSCKKRLTVNETNVKDEKKDEKKDDVKALKAMKAEFQKTKKSGVADSKLKEKLNKIAVKIAEDTSFKDKDVHLHPDIKDACLQDRERVCWACAGINCYIKQTLCKNHRVKRQFLGQCKGKKATFGDLSKYGLVEQPSTPTHSATTTPKPSNDVDYDSDTVAVAENMAMF